MNVTHPSVTQLLKMHEAIKTLSHNDRQAFMLAVDAMAPIPVAAALLAMQNAEDALLRAVGQKDGVSP